MNFYFVYVFEKPNLNHKYFIYKLYYDHYLGNNHKHQKCLYPNKKFMK